MPDELMDSGDRNDQGDRLVLEAFACPQCGERRLAYLDWVQPHLDEVECATCGFLYDPADPNP